MKSIFLSALLLISLNLFSQTLLTPQGDTVPHVTERRIAPLKAVKMAGDTVEISITLSSDFKVVNNALALANPSQPTVGDHTDWNQTLVAASSGRRVFTFRSVPSDTKSFNIIKNGLVLEEGLHYTVAGNNVTFLSQVQNGTHLTLIRKW